VKLNDIAGNFCDSDCACTRVTRPAHTHVSHRFVLAAGDFDATGLATSTAAGFGRATAVEVAVFLALALVVEVALDAPDLVLTAGFLETGIAAIDVEVKLKTEKPSQSVQVDSPSVSTGL
jgi:hypothetical protein